MRHARLLVRALTLLALVAGALVWTADPAAACSCVRPPDGVDVDTHLDDRADVIAVATAVRFRHVDFDPSDRDNTGTHEYEFAVAETIKGRLDPGAVVETAPNGALCGAFFELGATYRLRLWLLDDGTLQAHACLSSTVLDQPAVTAATTDAAGGVWTFRGGTVTPPAGERSDSLSPLVNDDVVDAAVLSDGGVLLLGADGGVFALNGAPFLGSGQPFAPVARAVALVPTPDESGYWIVFADGGVFSFGTAAFHGSAAPFGPVRPIVDAVATPSGAGYWLIAADGGVFSFGDATFHGSTGGIALVAPVVAAATPSTGGGYWLLAADGGVFAFGSAAFRGAPHAGPYDDGGSVDIAPSFDGYAVVGANGCVQHFDSVPRIEIVPPFCEPRP